MKRIIGLVVVVAFAAVSAFAMYCEISRKNNEEFVLKRMSEKYIVAWFSDKGSVPKNEQSTSRDYAFTFEVSALDGKATIDTNTFVIAVDGAKGDEDCLYYYIVESTAEESSDGVFLVYPGYPKIFTIVATVSNIQTSGRYAVRLKRVGNITIKSENFRTDYHLINQP